MITSNDKVFQMYLKRSRIGEIVETVEQSFGRVAYGIAAYDESPVQFGAWLLREMLLLRLLPNRPAWFGLGRETSMASACTMLDMQDDLAREPDGIGHTLLDIMRIQQAGSGVGLRVDRLRPCGDWITRTGGRATGPCGFLQGFNALLRTIQQGGYLQGANNAAMLVSYPDVVEFTGLKLDENGLDQYNTNIYLTDEFLKAVSNDTEFQLRWGGEVYKTVSARALFKQITHAMWVNGGVGIQFYDTIQRGNAIPGYGDLVVSNPCGEFFGFDRESCCPSYINLVEFVDDQGIKWAALGEIARLSTRMLDNLVDANGYLPSVPKLEKMAKLTRRIGTGFVGLADALIMLDLHYDSPAARGTASQIMEWILYNCMLESISLAQKRGAFPLFDQSVYTDWQPPAPPQDHDVGLKHPPFDWPDPSSGIRNCGLTVIAPGSFGSQTMGTEGYGCEPIFAADYVRSTVRAGEQTNISRLVEYTAFVTALELSPSAHVEMVAGLQSFTTEGIAKTVNLLNSATVEDIRDVVMQAWTLGLKGVTVYRSGSRDIEVLCPQCQVVPGK
jgi:ribonucleoside-diphosphate reductase alpha chain